MDSNNNPPPPRPRPPLPVHTSQDPNLQMRPPMPVRPASGMGYQPQMASQQFSGPAQMQQPPRPIMNMRPTVDGVTSTGPRPAHPNLPPHFSQAPVPGMAQDFAAGSFQPRPMPPVNTLAGPALPRPMAPITSPTNFQLAPRPVESAPQQIQPSPFASPPSNASGIRPLSIPQFQQTRPPIPVPSGPHQTTNVQPFALPPRPMVPTSDAARPSGPRPSPFSAPPPSAGPSQVSPVRPDAVLPLSGQPQAQAQAQMPQFTPGPPRPSPPSIAQSPIPMNAGPAHPQPLSAHPSLMQPLPTNAPLPRPVMYGPGPGAPPRPGMVSPTSQPVQAPTRPGMPPMGRPPMINPVLTSAPQMYSGPGAMASGPYPSAGVPAGYPGAMPAQRPMMPGAPMGMMQQSPQGMMPPTHPPPPKVNPASIPSVVAVLEADEARFLQSGVPYYTNSSMAEQPPPLPTTRSVRIIDDGNSSPSLIRSTLYNVPVSEEICTNSKIPLSLIIQPFADVSKTEGPVNIVDLGPDGPIRCHRCRGYINPHVQFIKGGRFFVCNLCGMSNDVPDEYYANLDMSGRRIDLDVRPELRYGTVDFVAGKSYMNKPACRPYLLFAIDTSRASIGSGSFSAAVEAIKAFACNEDALKCYGKVGVMTYDRIIQFFALRNGHHDPQLVIMSDINDPFVPMQDALFFDPVACSSQFSALISSLNAMHQEPNIVESCFGAAVSVALDAVKPFGGRIVFFQTTLPNYGPGALKSRDIGASAPSDKPHPLLFPQGDYYQKLGKAASEQGVAISLVCTPAGFIDLATIGQLVTLTSGVSWHLSKFNPQLHTTKLVNDLVSWLGLPFAFDIILRVRCGSGLQAKAYFGHCTTQNQTDYVFGGLNSEQSFAVLMEYDGKLSERERISFQCAALYTDSITGQRRIRVINLALSATSQMQPIFRMSELDSILSFYVKKNISQILEAPSAAFPASFTAKCVNILSAYRRYCAANTPSGQLILPDSLKLFPITTLAIHKDVAFSNAPVTIDTKVNAIMTLSALSMNMTITHFYPELYPVHNLLDHEEILPAAIRLSRENMSREGMYLWNNGHQLLLYIGDSVDSQLLNSIFGVNQLNAVSHNIHNLPLLNNPLSLKLRQVVTVLRSRHNRQLSLRFVRQSIDIAEDAEFSTTLIEDASQLGISSYADFICRIHQMIQQNLAQGSTLSLADKASILSFLQ